MDLKTLRTAWLEFYQKQGFAKIKSAPLIHPAFPLSFNMSSGLVQLDPQIRSPQKVSSQKQCLVQKCVRYFDIPRVGNTTHLSFFEMAGAFEIGEFNEAETVLNLWNFLTQVLKINPKSLWLTMFDQDETCGVKVKLNGELRRLCEKLTEKGKRLTLGGVETNWWQQGGGADLKDGLRLCGPQVEFFYNGSLEIGNIIFIKYGINTSGESKLINLVNPSIEAVIGLERVLQAVEEKNDIFETLAFKPFLPILSVRKINEDVSIIIDHIKALSFIFAEEKILPGRNGRRDVVRNLLRQMLASLYVLKTDAAKAVPALIQETVKIYGGFYPELKNCEKEAAKLILDYEKNFSSSVLKGKRRMEAYLEKNNIKKISQKDRDFFRVSFGLPEKLQKR